MMRNYVNSTYFTIFLLIIWDALKSYLTLSSPLLQLIFITPFVFLSFAANFKNGLIKAICSPPLIIWLIWIIYVLINTFIINGFNNHRNQNPFVFISSILICFIFVNLIVVSKSDSYYLVNLLIWAFFIRMLLSFVFDKSSIISNDVVNRLGSDFNSNSIANGALLCIIIIFYKKIMYAFINKFDILILSLAIITVFLAASKKVFILLVFFSLGYAYIFRTKNIIKNIFRFTLLSIVFGMFLFIAMNFTSVGTRINETMTKTINAKDPEKMFDSRAVQYIYGIQLFKENPINGIGLSNFVYASKIPTPLHSELLVQITECGLIGFLIFILFYYWLIKNLRMIHTDFYILKRITEFHILSIFIMFIFFLGIPIYNQPILWVLVALAIRFIKETQEIEYLLT